MRLRLPIMGHGLGPGGRLSLVVGLRVKRRSATVASNAATEYIKSYCSIFSVMKSLLTDRVIKLD